MGDEEEDCWNGGSEGLRLSDADDGFLEVIMSPPKEAESSESEFAAHGDDCSWEFVHSDGYDTPDSEEDADSDSDQGTDSENPGPMIASVFSAFNLVADEDYSSYVVRRSVLHFLPAKSLVRFKAVSKEWERWICSPFFAHLQSLFFGEISGFFRESYWTSTFVSLDPSVHGVPSPGLCFLPEKVFIRSACKGLLLCQGKGEEGAYYVCNPAIQEWTRLPPPNYYHGEEPTVVLAFEPSLLDFKAQYLVICSFSLAVCEVPVVAFEVYDSATRNWRLSSAEFTEVGGAMVQGPGFYFNGVAYWETSRGELLAFDVGNEICGAYSLPLNRTRNGVMSKVDGEFCYVQMHGRGGDSWAVEMYSGSLMSLKKTIEVKIPAEEWEECRAFPVESAGDVLAILIGDNLWVVRGGTAEWKLRMDEGYSSTARYFPYVNSLVSVN